MNTIIYVTPSPGCELSGEIMASAITPALRACDGTVTIMHAPSRMTRAAMAAHARANVDCEIFMEQIPDHPALMRARHRILIPNPEWLDPRTQARAAGCTHVWHKSHFSMTRLAPLFPKAEHAYLGFTSQDPGRLVAGYESFLHPRGKVYTHRNTDSIFAAWKSAPAWPDLHVQFYWEREGGMEYPGWLHDGNVHVRMGWLDRAAYLDLAGLHGIHLCTSEAEGFGHYIDEARAMGALVITTDGAPMNELVDESSGILVRPSGTSPMRWGTRFAITPEDLAQAVDRALSMSPQARRELGAAARERYLAEGLLFHQRAHALFAALDR